MKPKSNDLRHTIDIKNEKHNIRINIRLNDECKNGYQDFAITGEYWEADKPRTRRYERGWGCIHEEILSARPDLKIFVNLHLCDYTGAPTYCVENGFYHLREGFNNTKPNNKEFKAEYCEYYRISGEQFDKLNSAENEIRFAVLLEKLGILKQWKEEADKGIKIMEELTGVEFVVDSTKTQYHAPTAAQIKDEERKEREGFYTPEKIAERKRLAEIQEKERQYAEILEEMQKDCDKVKKEYEVKKAVLDGGLPLENFIFYTHSSEGVFNWKGYGPRVTHEDFSEFLKKAPVINGVTFRMDK